MKNGKISLELDFALVAVKLSKGINMPPCPKCDCPECERVDAYDYICMECDLSFTYLGGKPDGKELNNSKES